MSKYVVWVTGGSSGIGKAIVKEFVSVGSKVYVSSRRAAELERLKNEYENGSELISVVPCNVASWQNVEKAFKEISKEEKIDCLINNAGITSFKKFEDNSINEIDEIISTNLLGSIYCTKVVLSKMIQQQSGTIINILSVVTQKVFTQSSLYSAGKTGLLSFSDSLREEVRKHNIRIINVIPGATSTPIWSQQIRKEKNHLMMNPESVARVVVSAFLQSDNLVHEQIVIRPITGDL